MFFDTIKFLNLFVVIGVYLLFSCIYFEYKLFLFWKKRIFFYVFFNNVIFLLLLLYIIYLRVFLCICDKMKYVYINMILIWLYYINKG